MSESILERRSPLFLKHKAFRIIVRLKAFDGYQDRAEALVPRVKAAWHITRIQVFWEELQILILESYEAICWFQKDPLITFQDLSKEECEARLTRHMRRRLDAHALHLSQFEAYLDLLDRFELDRSLLLLRADDVRRDLERRVPPSRHINHTLNKTHTAFALHVERLRSIDLTRSCENPIERLNICSAMVFRLSHVLYTEIEKAHAGLY